MQVRAIYKEDDLRGGISSSTRPPATGEPPGLAPGVLRLGGQYTPETMLDPGGTSPMLPNTLNLEIFGQDYVLKAVAEIVALNDNPVYSFLGGVSVLVGKHVPMRTTEMAGENAVAELFAKQSAYAHNHYYHRFPWETRDRERDRAYAISGEAHIPDDEIDLSRNVQPPAEKGRIDLTRKLDVPTVGKIGNDDDGEEVLEEEEEEGTGAAPTQPPAVTRQGGVGILGSGRPRVQFAARPSPLASTAAPRPVPAITPAQSKSLLDAQKAQSGSLLTLDLADTEADRIDPAKVRGGVPMRLPAEAASATDAVVHASIRADGVDKDGNSMVTALPKNTNSSIGVPQADGSKHYVHGIENGDVTAVHMMLANTPVSEAQLRLWHEIYRGGEGSSRPVTSRPPSSVEAVRANQRSAIIGYARSVDANAHLHWRMLPQHLRLVFLTDEARTALEHATYLVHYQQPWDGQMSMPIQRNSYDRERVPLIDLMTHEMTRVPFQALVAYVLLYWRALRGVDRSDRQKDAEFYLREINAKINDFRTMHYNGGFLSIAGHYDPTAKATRMDTAELRQAQLNATGRFHSDLDHSVYTGGRRPRLTAASRPSSMLTVTRDRALERTDDPFKAAEEARRAMRLTNRILGIK